MQNTFTIDADIKKTSYFNQPTVTQNDDITFIVNISDDGQAFDLTNVTTVSLANTRLDKEVIVTPGEITGDNQVTFNLGTSETAVSSSVNAVVQLYDASGRVSTLSFSYVVKVDPTGAGYVPSTTEQTLIQVVLNDGPLRIQEAVDAAVYANEQGDYVEGKRPLIDKFTDEQTNLQTQITDLTTGLTVDAEVIGARGGKVSLNTRLNDTDTQLAQTETEQAMKNISPIFIKTFDGSNEPYHPSVLYFTNGWNGWKFWMAYTPYPVGKLPYTDRWECPSIAVSNDGYTWSTPVGLINPLDDLTPEQITRKDFFSDTNLVYDAVNNKIECWYRHSDGTALMTDVYRRITSNGINWGVKEKILDGYNGLNGLNTTSSPFRSASTFIDVTGKYIVMYNVNFGGLRRAESPNPSGGVWDNDVVVNMPAGKYNDPWHTGIVYENNVYHMTAYYPTLNTIEYLTSIDGYTFVHVKTIVDGGSRKYTNLDVLYQAVPVKVDAQWRVYSSTTFKARRSNGGTSKRNGIFMLIGDDLTSLHVSEVDTVKLDRQRFEGSIYLNSDDLPNSTISGVVLKYDEATDKSYSIDVAYHSTTRRPMPRYNNDKGVNTLATVRLAAENLRDFNYIGEIYVDINDRTRAWICTDVNTWMPITPPAKRLNSGASASIEVTGVNHIVINSTDGTNTISTLLGGVTGQEVTIVNTLPATPITIVHTNAYQAGTLHTKTGANLSLNERVAVKFKRISVDWFEV